jgi:enamine deaminase RidA (YjgF/YER057c/UK114 family)
MFRSAAPSSIAVRTDGGALLHISGQVARDDQGATVAPGDVAAQAHHVIGSLRRIVEDQGATLESICRLTIFVTRPEYLKAVLDVRRTYFRPPYPAATSVVVTALAHPDWLVEIEATAVLR